MQPAPKDLKLIEKYNNCISVLCIMSSDNELYRKFRWDSELSSISCYIGQDLILTTSDTDTEGLHRKILPKHLHARISKKSLIIHYVNVP